MVFPRVYSTAQELATNFTAIVTLMTIWRMQSAVFDL